MSLLKAIQKVASEHPETRTDLVPLIRKFSMEFDTPEAMKKYLKEHPDADRSKHKVKEKGTEKGKDTDEKMLAEGIKKINKMAPSVKKDLERLIDSDVRYTPADAKTEHGATFEYLGEAGGLATLRVETGEGKLWYAVEDDKGNTFETDSLDKAKSKFVSLAEKADKG